MSKFWRCDSCGRETKSWTMGKWQFTRLKRFNHELLTEDKKSWHWDLCANCTARLIGYMNVQDTILSKRNIEGAENVKET